MKRCTIAGASLRRDASAARRWLSYDKSALTREELTRQVQAGLEETIRIDAEAKTIATAAGKELPMSPLFDPDWIKTRRRERKPDAGHMSGRFRKKLALNPYARALAAPMRRCAVTSLWMPRSLLQDMELVRHPETDKAWYAPGPLAFDGVLPNRRKPEDDAETRKMGPEDDRPRRGPVTVYLLNRKDLLDALGPRSQQKTPYLLGRRRGATMVPEVQGAVWRDGLSDMVLGMMRRLAVDALIERATAPGDQTKFIQPVDDWDAVAGVQRRQSILWIRPEGEEEIPHHATYDVPDAKYGAKMAVHDLRRLLGDEELERLRQAAPETFGGPGQLSVLRAWRSHSMMNLHLLLWRLQGYLTPTPRTVKAKKPRQNMSVL